MLVNRSTSFRVAHKSQAVRPELQQVWAGPIVVECVHQLSFLHALGQVTAVAEYFKSKGDKVTCGKDLGGEYDNLAGSFMLFRGTPMQADWV